MLTARGDQGWHDTKYPVSYPPRLYWSFNILLSIKTIGGRQQSPDGMHSLTLNSSHLDCYCTHLCSPLRKDQTIVAITPAHPSIIGTSVRQLDHGYAEPPHVTPIKKLQVLETKRNPPIQST